MGYRYFNKNTQQVVSFEQPSKRLEFLQNWVTVEDDEHLAALQAGQDTRVPGLLGGPQIGGTKEPDPPHDPPSTDSGPELTSTPEDPLPDSTPLDPPQVAIGEPPPPTQPPDPEVEGPDPAHRPSKAATKDKWVDWAVECGADRADAKNYTKQDLIDIYGE